MKVLSVLEKKLVALLEIVTTLRTEKVQLTKENGALTQKLDDALELVKRLEKDNARSKEEVASLKSKLEVAQDSMLQNNESIKVLSEEKMVTKSAVDDLIKSIDALVAKETQ